MSAAAEGPASPATNPGGDAFKPRLEVVSATRRSQDDFWKRSPLGISLRRLPAEDGVAATIAFDNSRPLAELYNARILQEQAPGILAFVHDDVWIDDSHLADSVVAGLREHDVIGVAGNRRRVPRQPGWAFVDSSFTWDTDEHLSGRIAHAERPFGRISRFGPVPADCELLDGVFLAARRSRLVERDVLFDPQFEFHFYDMDFCRTARLQGLRLGTWPVSLTHQSRGAFGTASWSSRYQRYLDKWGD